jgi:hypothetical protein
MGLLSWLRGGPRAQPEVAAVAAPVQRAVGDWARVPILQPVLSEPSLLVDPRRFAAGLASWQDPTHLGPLGHAISPDAPAGTVHGVTHYAPPPTRVSTVDAPQVQRRHSPLPDALHIPTPPEDPQRQEIPPPEAGVEVHVPEAVRPVELPPAGVPAVPAPPPRTVQRQEASGAGPQGVHPVGSTWSDATAPPDEPQAVQPVEVSPEVPGISAETAGQRSEVAVVRPRESTFSVPRVEAEVVRPIDPPSPEVPTLGARPQVVQRREAAAPQVVQRYERAAEGPVLPQVVQRQETALPQVVQRQEVAAPAAVRPVDVPTLGAPTPGVPPQVVQRQDAAAEVARPVDVPTLGVPPQVVQRQQRAAPEVVRPVDVPSVGVVPTPGVPPQVVQPQERAAGEVVRLVDVPSLGVPSPVLQRREAAAPGAVRLGEVAAGVQREVLPQGFAPVGGGSAMRSRPGLGEPLPGLPPTAQRVSTVGVPTGPSGGAPAVPDLVYELGVPSESPVQRVTVADGWHAPAQRIAPVLPLVGDHPVVLRVPADAPPPAGAVPTVAVQWDRPARTTASTPPPPEPPRPSTVDSTLAAVPGISTAALAVAQFVAPSVQRADSAPDPSTRPADPTPADPPPEAPASTTTTTPPPPPAHSAQPQVTDELVRALYDPLSRLFRAELRLERERAGLLVDHGR